MTNNPVETVWHQELKDLDVKSHIKVISGNKLPSTTLNQAIFYDCMYNPNQINQQGSYIHGKPENVRKLNIFVTDFHGWIDEWMNEYINKHF